MDNKKQLRQTIREQRRALSASSQTNAARQVYDFISPLPFFTESEHIAVYLASDGEIDPHLLVVKAWQAGKTCYLPILDNSGINQLKFARYMPDTEMVDNRYGIPEPVHTPEELYEATVLDLVLTPLVAFDEQGNRMGMGKGFYDRTFEHIRLNPEIHATWLIGLAHSLQEVPDLSPAEWDVPLHGIATEEQLRLFR